MTMTNRLGNAEMGNTTTYREGFTNNANTTVFNSGLTAEKSGFSEKNIAQTPYQGLGNPAVFRDTSRGM